MSSAFDTYLYLLGPDKSRIEEDDNGGGGTDSRVPPRSGFFTLPSSGTYVIEVTSYSPGATGSYYLSLRGPTTGITVTSPNGGEIWQAGTTRTISWTYTGSPGSAVKIELYKGGYYHSTITSSTSIGSGSYNWTIPSTQTPGTDYKIKVTSTTNSAYYDYSDNNFTIIVDTTPPTNVQVTAPTSGQVVSGTFTFKATAQDNSGTVQKMEFYVDSDTAPACTDSTAKPSGSTFQCNWNTASKPNGSHMLKAKAYDPSGYSAFSSSVSFTINNVVSDTTPPTNVQVTSPVSGQTISGTFTLRGTAQDNSGTIQKMEFYIDSDTSPACSDTTPKASGSTFQCNWNTANKPNGSHTVRAKAYDPSGNFAFSSSVSFTINNVVSDTTPPTNVQVTSPVSGQTISGTFTLRGTAQDNSGTIQKMEFYIDSDTSPACSDTTPKASGSTFQCNWNTANKPNGSHMLKAKAYDPSGYSTSSSSVSFTINNQVPPTYALGVNKNAAQGGTVTSNPAGINCGTGCSTQTASFLAGTVVMLTATAASGWQFSSWSGCDSVSGNQCTVTMNGSRTVWANFTKVVRVANTSGYGLRLRTGPGLGYSVITTLSEGTQMTVIAGPVQADGYTWWKITGSPGTGWSAVGEWLTPITPQLNTMVTVTYTSGYGLRLRTGPGLSYSVITTLSEGTQMTVIAGPVQADGYTWWKITGSPGTGWSAVGNWLVPNPRY